jgi:hypothetical protein
MSATYVVTPADRERLRARMTAIRGEHLLPIINALASIAVLILPAGKQRLDVPKRGNWIAMVGDDLFTAAKGPSAFHIRSLRKLLERTSAVFIMSGKIVPESYAAAADICEAGANVLIVETQPHEEQSWVKFIQKHAPKAVLAVPKPTQRKAA